MANEDARYRQSTQFKLWSFSASKLSELREQTTSLATYHITSRLSSSQPTDKDAQPLPEFLTAAEEAQLLKHYTVELLRAAVFCELPTEVRATAAVFLRRFYITNSVMTYPPTDLLKTCLFFGSKAEGYYTRLAKLAEKFPNTSEEEILAGEFLLCQGIRFAFDVRHPFRALEGAILELRRHDNLQRSRVEAAHARAREILKFSSLVTDAYFHFTPSQVMLAALSLADRELAETLIHDAFAPSHKINNTISRNGEEDETTSNMQMQMHDIRDKVMGTIESCRDMLATEPPERMREFWETTESNRLIRPLLKKLKKCRDPDRADLVALQKARRELAAAPRETRLQKGQSDGAIFGGDGEMQSGNETRESKRRKVAVSDDVFGPELG